MLGKEKLANGKTAFRFKANGMRNKITVGGDGLLASVMGVFSNESIGCDVFYSNVKCDVGHRYLKLGDVMVFLDEKTLKDIDDFLKSEFKNRGYEGDPQ